MFYFSVWRGHEARQTVNEFNQPVIVNVSLQLPGLFLPAIVTEIICLGFRVNSFLVDDSWDNKRVNNQ